LTGVGADVIVAHRRNEAVESAASIADAEMRTPRTDSRETT